MIRFLPILLPAIMLCNVTIAQDFEAIERRLGEAVAEGELNLEQATRMMNALKENSNSAGSPMRRIEFARGKIKEAVKSGDMDEKDAHLKMAALEQRMKYAAVGREVRQAVADGKLSHAEAGEKMKLFGKKMKMASVALKIRHAVANGELTEEEEEARSKMEAIKKEFAGKGGGEKNVTDGTKKGDWREGKSVWAEFLRLGVSATSLSEIKAAFARQNLDVDQYDPTMNGMLRAVQTFKASGDLESDMDAGLVKYLEEEVGLEMEQVELVERLAKRISRGLAEK